MLSSLSIAALSLLACSSSASPISRAKTLKPRASASTLEATDNYLSLTRTKATHGLSALNKKPGGLPTSSGSSSGDVVGLSDIEVEEEWAVTITFGTEDVTVILDTGSSDLWLAQSGFQCVNETLYPVAEADCYFGPLYNGTFSGSDLISDENFNITYGDGEFLTGIVGYTDVTIGSITVKNQQANLATEAFWEGDGITSGLMGLAYSALTSDYAGTDPMLDNFNVTGDATGDQEPYSPVVQTMIAQGLNPPLFTLVLERSFDENDDVPGGYIAFGGTPPISGVVGQYVDTPITVHEYFEYPTLESVNRSFYSILPDAYVYEKNGIPVSVPTSYDGIVDSGTTLLYVPTDVANAYVASFEPPATYIEGYYYYPCVAVAPYFGITIAGYTFSINTADIILPDSGYIANDGVEYCLVGVVDGGSGADTFPVFGDVFLKNVVAVFDVGASILRFAEHTY